MCQKTQRAGSLAQTKYGGLGNSVDTISMIFEILESLS